MKADEHVGPATNKMRNTGKQIHLLVKRENQVKSSALGNRGRGVGWVLVALHAVWNRIDRGVMM